MLKEPKLLQSCWGRGEGGHVSQCSQSSRHSELRLSLISPHLLFPFCSLRGRTGSLVSCGYALSPTLLLEAAHIPPKLMLGGFFFFLVVFFFPPWLSKCTKVSLRQMANISPFLTSVKTSKSTFMTFHTEFYFTCHSKDIES